jgi:PAS domain S-box-containing protein
MDIVSDERKPELLNPAGNVSSIRSAFSTLTMIFGTGAALIGILGIIGMIFGISLFTGFFSGDKTIALSASVIWIIFGSVLVCHAATPLRGSVRTFTAVVVLFIAILAALEFPLNISGKHFIVETWSVQLGDAIAAQPTTPVSPVAIVLVVPAAIALFFMLYAYSPTKEENQARNVVGILGLAISLVSFTFVLSYIYGAPFLYNTPLIPIAFTSAIAGLCIGTGLITAAGPQAIPLKYFTGPLTRARLLRVFLPFTLIIILVQNFLMVTATSYYSIHNAILLSGSIVVFSIVTTYVVVKVSEGVSYAIDKAEKALRESEEKYRRIVETANEGIWSMSDTYTTLFVNRKMADMLGYAVEEMTGKKVSYYFYPEDLPDHDRQMERRMQGQDAIYERRFRHRDGSDRWMLISATVRKGAQGEFKGSFAMLTDITERKRAEEALRKAHDELENRVQQRTVELNRALETVGIERQRFYDVLETLPVYICLLTPDYHMPFANKYFRETLGESKGRRCYEFLFNRTEPCETCETYTVIKSRAPHHWYWTGPNGRDYDIYDFPFIERDGSFNILEMGIDITERKQAEESIRKSLNERELLLREIHHRVRNNLQIILSLISLQSRNIKDPYLLDTMGDFQNRIKAMAHVHERMCLVDDISRINLSEIVTFLGTSLFKSYKVDPHLIRLNVKMKDLQITIDSAIPISLILNELITNSIKHAFPKRTAGEITIAGRREADNLVLSVSDTGIGMPKDFDWMSSNQSLGHRLVVSLVEQLNGTIELDRITGTVFKIVVKEKQ